MSAKKPIRPYKKAWRIRGTDGKWREVEEGSLMGSFIRLPEHEWSAVIPDETGLKIFTFIMN